MTLRLLFECICMARKLGSGLTGTARMPAPIDAAVEIWGQTRGAWRALRKTARIRA
jgi:hypothetical protein